MKISRIVLFGLMYIISIPSAFAQDDTIFISENRYRVTHRKSAKTLNTQVDSVKFLLQEFSEYTVEGKLVGSRRFFDKNQLLTILLTDEGIKRFERYMNISTGIGHESTWDETGKKSYQIIQCEDAKISTYYYPRQEIIQKIIDESSYNYSFDSLEIKSTNKDTIAIEKESFDKSQYKKELVIEFFENGHVKSEKCFIYKTFDIYSFNKDKRTQDNIKDSNFIAHIEKIKTNIWKFYHPDGSIEREEDYTHITFKNIYEP